MVYRSGTCDFFDIWTKANEMRNRTVAQPRDYIRSKYSRNIPGIFQPRYEILMQCSGNVLEIFQVYFNVRYYVFFNAGLNGFKVEEK